MRSKLFSPFAWLLTAINLTILIVFFALFQNQLFLPGNLSAQSLPGIELQGYSSHLEFQHRCDLCHQPLQHAMTDLCLDCHTTTAEEIATQSGVHATLTASQKCYDCHSEHKGQDFDLSSQARMNYPHELSGFSLTMHQIDFQAHEIECEVCHANRTNEFTPQACIDCHTEANTAFMTGHTQVYPQPCITCHDGVDSLLNFNHQLSNFPLAGKHMALTCDQCHTQGNFENLDPACVTCHTEPLQHAGVFSVDCQECHDAHSWKPAMFNDQWFDHQASTRFSLIKHPDQICTDCHTGQDFSTSGDACAACHVNLQPEFLPAHMLQFGPQCISCHDGVDRMENFDHNTIFSLSGGHADLACESCHANFGYQDTPAECRACHAEPSIHAGLFGQQCEYCHTINAWSPATLTQHTFPLDHGDQGTIACKTCHTDNYTRYTCSACHIDNDMRSEHDELGLTPDELSNCTTCHPTGSSEEDDD